MNGNAVTCDSCVPAQWRAVQDARTNTKAACQPTCRLKTLHVTRFTLFIEMLYTDKLNVIYKTELIIDTIDCLKIRNKNIIHNTHAQYTFESTNLARYIYY